jgi:hypothetical protein
MARFHEGLGLGSDPDLAALLRSAGHDAERPLPASLSRVLVELRPVRFSLIAGVEQRGQRLAYLWFLPDLTLRGPPEEGGEAVDEAMVARGFTSAAVRTSGRGLPLRSYHLVAGDVEHRVRFEGPEPHQGGSEVRCSGTLHWEAVSVSAVQAPPVGRALSIHPDLSCIAVPDAFARALGPRGFTRIRCGGTRTGHYALTVAIASGSPEQSEELMASFSLLAADQGYEPFKEAERSRVLVKAEPGRSYLYITRPEVGGLVLRLQN